MKNLNSLFVLLENKKLPLLEHLSVTFSKQKQQQLEQHFEQIKFINMTIHLRSLRLTYMSLQSLVMFLSLVKMPLLEKLVLINIYDNSMFNFRNKISDIDVLIFSSSTSFRFSTLYSIKNKFSSTSYVIS